VTYSPSGKVGFLGVRKETIEHFGLTSEEVASEMACGALAQQACCADVAVANTGLADGKATDGTPPGTQCFARAYRLRDGRIETFSETRLFKGERNEVRHAAALHALERIPHDFDALPRLVNRTTPT